MKLYDDFEFYPEEKECKQNTFGIFSTSKGSSPSPNRLPCEKNTITLNKSFKINFTYEIIPGP